MKIRKKILLFVIPVSLLPLIFIGIYSYNSLDSGFNEQIFLENKQLCNLAATKLELLLDECRNGIMLISSAISTKLQDERYLKKFINHTVEKDSLLTGIVQQFAIHYSPHLTIRIISADGYEIFSQNGMSSDEKAKPFREVNAFLKAVAVSAQNLSAIQFPPENNASDEMITRFCAPLYKNETLYGFVFLDLDLKSISKIFKNVSGIFPGEYLLVDGRKRVLASSGIIPKESTIENEYFRSYMQEVFSNTNYETPHANYSAGGIKYFSTAQLIKEYIVFRDIAPEDNWYLFLTRSQTPLHDVFLQSRLIFIIVLMLCLSTAIIGTLIISKKITKPISGLSEAANKIATGDLDIVIQKNSEDEIGELGCNLNKMTADLKRLIEQVKADETLTAIGRFSASLTHDLKNPVEGLKLLSAELVNRVQQNQSEFKVADAIQKSVNRLSSLIAQSLDFARLNKPIFARTDIVSLIEEVLQDFQFENIEFSKKCDDIPQPIEADASQLKRVISNLIKNSVDACGKNEFNKKCRIHLEIINKFSEVEIRLLDTGIGIPAEALERIFEPFYTTKQDGHGLGLSFARQIISNHNGIIKINSSPGEGTEISIELPASQCL